MANVQIANLPLYTGDTTGAYLVMNNSAQTVTYKVTKETFIGSSGTSGSSGSSGSSGTSGSSGSSGINGTNGTSGTSGTIVSSGWTIAGTISQVGWSATTTAPTISGFGLPSEVAIWQLSPKQYQLAMTFRTTGSGNSDGLGDYLFTLPSGLQFDTRLAFQTIYSGSVQTSDTTLGKYVIPSGSGMISDGAGSVSTNLMPIVWDATRFRILAHQPGTAIKCIGSNWYQVTAPIGFTLTFTFTVM